MFAITAGVLAILAVNMIRIMNVAVKIRDIINNNVTSALSYIFITICVFTIVLILIAIILQVAFVIHSWNPHGGYNKNSITKICVASIDTIVMISFVVETHKTYAYSYLMFCIVLLYLSVAQLIYLRKYSNIIVI